MPRLCFEVVSENHPYKDYAEVPERYAAMGTRELVVFDPLLAGPVALGGPVPLQIWRRTDPATFERVYFGEGPAFSVELRAWLHPDGDRLRFTDDIEGTLRWPTALERALADKERALAEKERERAQKERAIEEKTRAIEEKTRERTLREAVERRIRELEEKLGGR